MPQPQQLLLPPSSRGNVAKNLALAVLGSEAAALAFLVALPVPFFLMGVALGLRPAPALLASHDWNSHST